MISSRKIIYCILTFLSILSFVMCSNHKTLNIDETYSKLKPVALLPEALAEKQSPNLIVTIENVADMSRSYKNKLELYVNDCLIKPEEGIHNIKSSYHYKIKLQPGIYKVKALYYASTGWVEKSYPIVPPENVMVFRDKETILNVRLKKDSVGAPIDKVTKFKVAYEPIQKEVKSKEEIANK